MGATLGSLEASSQISVASLGIVRIALCRSHSKSTMLSASNSDIFSPFFPSDDTTAARTSCSSSPPPGGGEGSAEGSLIKYQKCKNAKMQKCKNAKMQKCKNAK